MKVFAAGGAGVIGRRLVPQLVARGHDVTATTTNANKLGGLERLGAHAVVMDGLDAVSVGEAVATAEPDVIVHQMTAIPEKLNTRHPERSFATTNRLRTEGIDHLVAAAQAADVKHFVAQSYASWNGIREGGWVKTEDDPLDPDHLATPSLRHIDDMVSATVLAVEQQAKGVFNTVDDEPAPVSEWQPYLAECVDAKPPMHLPAWLIRPLAAEFVVWMMTQGRAFSNNKAKRELNWQLHFPSWRQGFAEGLR